LTDRLPYVFPFWAIHDFLLSLPWTFILSLLAGEFVCFTFLLSCTGGYLLNSFFSFQYSAAHCD
jgi:hypothetical protein